MSIATLLDNSTTNCELDIHAVKAQFPIFVNNELTADLAYLDNGATTHKPQQVLDAINKATCQFHAPVNRGFYQLGELSSDAYEQARIAVQNFIGAERPESIIFTASATDSINQISQIYFADRVQPDQTIWVSRMEHHANYLPWQALAKANHAKLGVIELTEDGELDLASYPTLFSSDTALIAITHTSNVIGVQNNINEICKKSRSAGIPVVVDGAQAMVSNQINVSEIDCDFWVFSAHKMFGPNGIGVLYINPNVLNDCKPSRLGGGMVDFVADEFSETIWTEAPYCFEAGSPNLPGAIGLASACEFIQHQGQDRIKNHIKALAERLFQQLKQFSHIKVVTPQKHLASGIVSFYHEVIHAHDLAQILGDNQVAVRAGHHCAQPLLEYLKTSSTLRISLSIYNQESDLEKTISAIKQAEELFI